MKSFAICVFGTVMVARSVEGHGSMIMPPSRNSVDSELPAWANGHFPPTGTIEPYACTCTNGTDVCNAGQSCFWFSQGCSIGCKACDGKGARIPNYDHCPGESIKATLNDPKYRTANVHAEAGSDQDIFKHNPWRAPGMAPVFDACGMAGGNYFEVFNAGAYNTTKFAKQGDLGTKVLPVRKSGTVWTRGDVATTRWELTAAHGGGYQYRLCPASEPLTEACFQKMPLEFATPDKHMVVYANSSMNHEINATLVREGGGIGWMRHPIPRITSEACDYVVPAGKHCNFPCPGCGAPKYSADGACPGNCKEHYPQWDLPENTGSDPALFPNPIPQGMHDWAIEDTLKVPTNIPAGEYVVGWRWDAETTSQVWSSCADITIE